MRKTLDSFSAVELFNGIQCHPEITPAERCHLQSPLWDWHDQTRRDAAPHFPMLSGIFPDQKSMAGMQLSHLGTSGTGLDTCRIGERGGTRTLDPMIKRQGRHLSTAA
jgi:hypothetical protein